MVQGFEGACIPVCHCLGVSRRVGGSGELGGLRVVWV